jgi:branched-chain amino acid transport system substrate-binding protein
MTFGTKRLCGAVALGVGLAAPAVAQDIKVGHLTYHTGEYGAWGAFFDGVADMSLDIINQDPPLGRKLVVIHQDIGTTGEAMAARKLVDSDGVDILLNPAHSYMSYRDFILGKIAETGRPLLPSVHGGAIEAAYGGQPDEPLFRGSPMDTALATATLVHVRDAGKTRVVIFATEVAGSQMQTAWAQDLAGEMGLEVVGAFDIQPGQPNYRSIVSRAAGLDPDAVIIFSAPADGGAIVKNAAEAGANWFVVGTSEWQETEFADTATAGAIARHEQVVFVAFAPEEGPAWEYYEPVAAASAQAEAIGDVSNSYAIQYYDLLISTALAIEAAGSTDAKAWTEAMFKVTGGEGEVVHSYADGIAALRAGKDINYEGVTGSMDYSANGVVPGLFGVFTWKDGVLERVGSVDGDVVMALEN